MMFGLLKEKVEKNILIPYIKDVVKEIDVSNKKDCHYTH